jgi:hypothetical protein
MAIIEEVTLINAPADLAFRVSQDNTVRYEWDPAPEQLSLVASGSPPQGTAPQFASGTQVRTRFGIEIRVKYEQRSPPISAAIEMVGGPKIIDNYSGAWIFEERSPTHTFATFRYTITAKPSLLRWPIERIAALYLAAIARKRLAALKDYCQKRHLMGQGKILPKRRKPIPRF